jgi:hypothetical protein
VDPEALGKTTTGLDSVDARFVELVPNVRGVQAVDLTSDDPANDRMMTRTCALAAVNAGTNVHIRTDDVPAGAMPARRKTQGSPSPPVVSPRLSPFKPGLRPRLVGWR